MKLDARYPDLDFSLQTWHRRLNRRFLWGEAFVGWSAATVFAAAALFESSLAARWSVWLTSAAAVTLAYALWQSRQRLTRHQAASWLDEAARTTGVFRAASECLDREHPGPQERAVLEEASKQLPRGVQVPWRRLALRAAMAAVLSAAAGWLVLTPPAPARLASAAGTEAAPTAPRTVPGASESRELTSREAAKRLFPENERLAALAEQALASGDPGALESLLDQNSAEADPAAAAQVRQGTGAGEGSSEESPGADKNSAPGSGGPSAQQRRGNGEAGQGSQGDSERSGGDSQRSGGNESRPGVGGMAQGQGRGQGGDSGNNQPRAGESPFSSGGAAGDGHSDLAFGPADKGRSRQNLTLKEGQNPGLFEYVLPGNGPRLPSGGALADSKRSAEAALARVTPPLEYENAVRDYFLSLSQEVSP